MLLQVESGREELPKGIIAEQREKRIVYVITKPGYPFQPSKVNA